MSRVQIRLVLVIAGLFLTAVAWQALAGVTVYTDRAAWLRDVRGGSPFVVSFNEFNRDIGLSIEPLLFNAYNVSDAGGLRSLPMFTAAVAGGSSPPGTNLVDVPPFENTFAENSGFTTPHLVLYGDDTTAPVLRFLRPTTAFAADVEVLDGQSQITFDTGSRASPIVVPGPTRSGFFGVISDLPFNAYNFGVALSPSPDRINSAAGGFRLALDNIQVLDAPEPTTVCLLFCGTVQGLCYLGWRRHRSRLTAC